MGRRWSSPSINFDAPQYRGNTTTIDATSWSASSTESEQGDSFTLFPKLPAELRLGIWKVYVESEAAVGRDVEVSIYLRENEDPTKLIRRIQLLSPNPPMFHVCHESRTEGLKLNVYKTGFMMTDEDGRENHLIYINPNLDTLIVRIPMWSRSWLRHFENSLTTWSCHHLTPGHYQAIESPSPWNDMKMGAAWASKTFCAIHNQKKRELMLAFQGFEDNVKYKDVCDDMYEILESVADSQGEFYEFTDEDDGVDADWWLCRLVDWDSVWNSLFQDLESHSNGFDLESGFYDSDDSMTEPDTLRDDITTMDLERNCTC